MKAWTLKLERANAHVHVQDRLPDDLAIPRELCELWKPCAHDLLPKVMLMVQNQLDAWVKEWQLTMAEQQKLYLAAADLLRANKARPRALLSHTAQVFAHLPLCLHFRNVWIRPVPCTIPSMHTPVRERPASEICCQWEQSRRLWAAGTESGNDWELQILLLCCRRGRLC